VSAIVSDKAIGDLGFDRIRSVLAGLCHSDRGRELAQVIEPTADLEELRSRRTLHEQARRLTDNAGRPDLQCPDLRPALLRLSRGEPALEPAWLLQIASAEEAVRQGLDLIKEVKDESKFGPKARYLEGLLGYIGGIDPPVVAYQQVVEGNSDLKLYDVDTRARSDPPAGVNTSNWEWEPSISGDWLLFARQTNSAQFVILRSLTTAAKVVLDQGRRFHHAGQVSDDYAVWTRCGKTACNVVRRQLSTATDTVLARPADRFQYGAAVTSTGIVYVARSSPKCGGSVKIARFFGAGDAADGTVVADLGANGWDLWSAYARENDDESVDVFYDRLLCGGNKADIYRVHDPHPGP